MQIRNSNLRYAESPDSRILLGDALASGARRKYLFSSEDRDAVKPTALSENSRHFLNITPIYAFGEGVLEALP